MGTDRSVGGIFGLDNMQEPTIELFAGDAAVKVGLHQTADGSSELSLVGEKADGLVQVAVDADGIPSLSMHHGDSYVDLSCDKDAGPRLTLQNMSGTMRVQLAEEELSGDLPGLQKAGNVGPELVIFDESYAKRALLGLDSDGAVRLVLFDGHLRPRLLLAIGVDGRAKVTILDDEAQEVFSAP